MRAACGAAAAPVVRLNSAHLAAPVAVGQPVRRPACSASGGGGARRRVCLSRNGPSLGPISDIESASSGGGGASSSGSGGAAAAPPLPAEVAAAWAQLTDLTQKDFRGLARPLTATPAQRDGLRRALLAVYASANPAEGWPGAGAQPPPDVLLGLLSSDVRLAVRALRDWTAGLGLPYVAPVSRIDGGGPLAAVRGGVYLKYNARACMAYVTLYEGQDRGVLVQLGQAQLGHFPLGLFDEGMASPPPPL
jgi:hypothetical protein